MDNPEMKRAEDSLRPIHARLDSQDQNIDQIQMELNAIATKVSLTEQAVKYQYELLGERFRTLEGTGTSLLARQEQLFQKIDTLQHTVSTMGSDSMQTPAGRAVQQEMMQLDKKDSVLAERLKVIEDWRGGIDTVLGVLKWLGPAGGVALAVALWNYWGHLR